MHQQVSAERRKRAEILESEGQRQAAINVAEGQKQSQILESEAYKARQINSAEGEAQSILLKGYSWLTTAQANAEAIARISKALLDEKSKEAVQLNIAEKYIESFGNIAKESTTVVVPQNVSDAAGMVTQLMAVMKANK